MPPFSDPAAARRGRRLLAALAAAACLLTASSLAGGTQAATAAPTAAGRPVIRRSPTPSPVAESPTPSGCFFGPDFCPTSPSPSPVITVSPVPPDPSPSPSTPSYLVGINPTPSPTPNTTDSISSPVPLGGGFVDQLPTPSGAATQASAGDIAPHSSGLPLPFLAVGGLLILAAIGSLIYAIVPRGKPAFEPTRRASTSSPVMFTPYGPDIPGANILKGPKPPTT